MLTPGRYVGAEAVEEDDEPFDDKMQRLHQILAELVRVEASLPQVISAYGELYSIGRPKGHPCGENDLWIAATAKAVNASLLTADADFDWMHPQHLHVVKPSWAT